MILLNPIEVVSGLFEYEQILNINCDQGCSTFDQKFEFLAIEQHKY